MHRRALERSGKLYALLDASNGFYTPLGCVMVVVCTAHVLVCAYALTLARVVAREARSRMNIVFRIKGKDEALEKLFCEVRETLHMLEI
jgi:hypothetical protein